VKTSVLQEERRALPAQGGDPGSTALVSCGVPIPGTEISIRDEHDVPLSDRQVGEIAIRSDCMLNGYYRRLDLTKQSVRAGWYYTGDMGYMADGELYITGRKKDMIIVGGKNIYPQDLEAIANTTPGIAPGRGVAFGLFDKNLGSENIIMVCELEGKGKSETEKKNIEMELRSRVVQRSEIALADVRLIEGRWLIKTSSGKIARSANRDRYIHNFLEDEE
jgi:acyl-CoA synthetase (AMP-forming)/AMP-acid ligase II